MFVKIALNKHKYLHIGIVYRVWGLGHAVDLGIGDLETVSEPRKAE